jgi:hypothetical protein
VLDRIERRGKLVHECSLAGETRADDVFPGHPNGIPLSRDRWLLIYATRGWRTVDDDRSIVYQVRRDRPDGEVLAEGILGLTVDDWDPHGDGSRYSRNHGHPVAFGVPKDAVIGGKPAVNANLFVLKWRVTARDLTPVARGQSVRNLDESGRAQYVEWVQCRLNGAGSDIEIVQRRQPMRQRGYDTWHPFCRHGDVRWMNQTFVQAVPFNRDATEWVDVNHFDGSRIAPLKYRFNAKTGLYEWVEIGPLVKDAKLPLSEASIARSGNDFVICARSDNAIGWIRAADPFGELHAPVFTTDPAINSPVAMYACPDGALRILTGSVATSPYGHGRCPLYIWEIDPQTFRSGKPVLVFDPIAEGILPRETGPRAEMCKLLTHMGGREQTLVWRVRTKNVGRQYGSLPPVTPEWKEQHGLYHASLVYGEDNPGEWQFAD